ncbi:uncharacterized protein LOC135145939 [Zophobas morio]|uniref:uncharacterized protein LOC135145939 n=1 Tax=Zophobas morio TaxID=2755281 RepID=UPI0030827F27
MCEPSKCRCSRVLTSREAVCLEWPLWVFSFALWICSLILINTKDPHNRVVLLSDARYWSAPHKSTLPYYAVVLFGLFVYTPFSLLLEYLACQGWKSTRRTEAVYRSLRMIAGLLCSVANVVFVTDLTKVLVGGLRPDFLYRCNNGDHSAAIQEDLSSNLGCLNPDVSESRKSFFSGHTSTAMSFGFFLTLQLLWHSFTTYKRSPVTRSLLVCLALIPIYLSWLVAISRLNDYRHHYVDVATGMLFAILITALIFLSIAGNIRADFGQTYES